jgi:ribosomal protein S18 acetylase RimI-like enzyme
VRWGIRRDMPRVLLIERETGGAWSEDDFLFHLAERNKILIVAEGPAGEVTGFAVYHLQEYAIAVLDMAALDPAARAAILAKLAYKGEQHRRPLVWSDGAPF